MPYQLLHLSKNHRSSTIYCC